MHDAAAPCSHDNKSTTQGLAREQSIFATSKLQMVMKIKRTEASVGF
jgi:hypothetical protein